MDVLGSGAYGDVYKISWDIRSLSGTTTVSSESALKIISIPRDNREIDSLGENPDIILQSSEVSMT